MKGKQFYKFIIFVILILLLITLGLISLNLNASSRAQDFKVKGDVNSAEVANQQIEILFSRPMDKESFQKNITIYPESEFSISWSGQRRLFISFKTILENSKNYTVIIKKDVKDAGGKKVAEDYIIKFTTKPIQFAYLDRGNETQNVILAEIGSDQTRTLFSHPDIEFYDIHKDLLIIAIENPKDYSSNIFLKNLKTNRIIDFELENKIVNSLQFNHVTSEIFITMQDGEKYGETLVPMSGNRIYRVSEIKDDKVILEQINPQATASDILSFLISEDGRFIVYKSSNSNFYLNYLNTDEVISLGQFIDINDVNLNNELIYSHFEFFSGDSVGSYIVKQNSSRDTKVLTSKKKQSFDAQFFNKSNKIVYSERYSEEVGTHGLFKIMLFDLDKSETIELIRVENRSLETAKISLDDNYLFIESFSKEDLRNYVNTREYQSQTKPFSGDIIIYNLREDKILGVISKAVEVRIVR